MTRKRKRKPRPGMSLESRRTVVCSWSPHQWQFVQTAARRCGLSIQGYVRTAVLATAYADLGTARKQEIE